MNTRHGVMAALAALLLISASANAALVSRAGGLAYYDTVLDITWLADANLAASNTFGVTGINSSGTMTWAKANEWIAAMNAANHLGANTWRLQEVNPINGSSFDYIYRNDGSTDRGYNQSAPGTTYAGATGSEMAHLYYNTLGNLASCSPSSPTSCVTQPGWGLLNTGPFSNLQLSYYWSGTTFALDPSSAFHFLFVFGSQDTSFKSYSNYAWAVSPGDVLIPVPAAVWMFISALGVVGLLRRKMRTGTA